MDYRQAKTIIPHGCDADELRRYLRRVATQGMPYTNRQTRRHAQRVGDAARARRARREASR